jgi:hypothetical protein
LFWSDRDKKGAPRLHRLKYTSDDVRKNIGGIRSEQKLNEMDVFTHLSSANYLWQSRVADRVYRMTGVRLLQSSYRVP